MARKSTVTGDRQIARNLRELQRLVLRPVGEAQRFALAPVLSAAKANVRTMGIEDTGELRRSLTVKKDGKAPKMKPTYVLGPRSDSPAVRYAHLVEFGTDPHWVNGGRHPGASPKPFLTNAFESKKKEAIDRFGKKLGPAIEAQAARLGRKK
jgi:HK97 gp10 family phage protein